MKVRILQVALVISLLLNGVGVFFFVWFLQTSNHLRHVKKEKNVIAQNMALMRGQKNVNDVLHSDDVIKSTFISQFDGQEDSFAVLPPTAAKPDAGYDLIVYLHGMGSTFLEPFVCPDAKPIAREITGKRPQLIFSSLNYRRAYSWGTDAAISDITQNIREIMQRYPVNRIVLMGTSMGGCTVLTYSALAPADIKSKLVGVVSSEGAGDLTRLFHETKNASIPPALQNAFGGRPEMVPERYQKQSFIPNIEQVKSDARYAILSATKDTIVPPRFQKDLIELLTKRNMQAHLIEIDSGHGVPPAEFYMQGLEFVLDGVKS
ncbi:MAG: alpha/beta hydrolase [Leptolyngbya sp.]|nr:alpha/beta hydrolase [Candidatus Melainabacteria bacterium]